MTDSQYGPLDRFLHRMALHYLSVAEMSFDLDQAMVRTDPQAIAGRRHVFVSGLARAGTTVLMRRLHASEQFRSLTYRDMPFVLAPNLWSRIGGASRRHVEAAERAHGDRLVVDLDSPESLDEVFWRVFAGDEYLKPDRLVPHAPTDAVVAKYVRYVNAILASDPAGRGRYLCKDNNNILRLGAIRRAFPEAVILVPFRNPFSHAESLRRQHAQFCALQAQDRFAQDYMTWLAHHEFGLGHRRFRFGAAEPTGAGPESLGYWLSLWIETYSWLERTRPPSAHFVCYEDLCADPQVWAAVARLAEVRPDAVGSEPFDASTQTPPDPGGLPDADAAQALYARLRATALRQGRV